MQRSADREGGNPGHKLKQKLCSVTNQSYADNLKNGDIILWERKIATEDGYKQGDTRG